MFAGFEAAHKLFSQIEAIVLASLKACQGVIINDRHCFELYGYDIIVDADLKPWLIEVNASPSLAASTPADRLMKAQVINDVLNVVAPLEWQRGTSARPRSAITPSRVRTPSNTHCPSVLGFLVDTLHAMYVAAVQVDSAERRTEPRPPNQCGSMRLLYDETDELDAQRAARDAQLSDVRKTKRSTMLGIYCT